MLGRLRSNWIETKRWPELCAGGLMAHQEQKQFCEYVKGKLPDKFHKVSVLDIGSLDINGNNRYLFTNYHYIGIDIGPGNNVDIISRGHEYTSDFLYDVVISTETFEHDEFYPQTIQNMYKLLKPNGLFLFTCATTGRPEHGTTRTSPQDAPFIGDYYKNLTEADIRAVIDVEASFSQFEFQSRQNPADLYFYGVKVDDSPPCCPR